MSFDPERLDIAQPATKAESAALLAEVVNIALYGDEDPWNLRLESGLELPKIEKGFIAKASSKIGGASILCKYDRNGGGTFAYGSQEKVHVASLTIGEKTYDMFVSTPIDYLPEDGDLLEEMFSLLEDYEGTEGIEAVRVLDFDSLAEAVTIEVFEDLPVDGSFLRNMGKLGLQFARLIDDQSTPGQTAAAEGVLQFAESTDAARAMELGMSATTIDGQTARALTAALREDYDPIVRW